MIVSEVAVAETQKKNSGPFQKAVRLPWQKPGLTWEQQMKLKKDLEANGGQPLEAWEKPGMSWEQKRSAKRRYESRQAFARDSFSS